MLAISLFAAAAFAALGQELAEAGVPVVVASDAVAMPGAIPVASLDAAWRWLADQRPEDRSPAR